MAPGPREPGPRRRRVVPGVAVLRLRGRPVRPRQPRWRAERARGHDLGAPSTLPWSISRRLRAAGGSRWTCWWPRVTAASTPRRRGNAGPWLRDEIEGERPAILMLRLLDAPGGGRDVYHYVVADGVRPRGGGWFRFQFGDGQKAAGWGSARVGGEGLAGHRSRAPRGLAERERTTCTLRRAVALEGEGRVDDAVALYREVLEVRPLVGASVGRPRQRPRRVRRRPGRGRSGPTAARSRSRGRGIGTRSTTSAWLLFEQGTRLGGSGGVSLARAASGDGPGRPLPRLGHPRPDPARARPLPRRPLRSFSEALASDSPVATAASISVSARRGLDARPTALRASRRVGPETASESLGPRQEGRRLRRRTCAGSSPTGSVKQNVAPPPGPGDSIQTRPPCRSTMRLTSARPTPVPSLAASSLSNSRKTAPGGGGDAARRCRARRRRQRATRAHADVDPGPRTRRP